MTNARKRENLRVGIEGRSKKWIELKRFEG